MRFDFLTNLSQLQNRIEDRMHDLVFLENEEGIMKDYDEDYVYDDPNDSVYDSDFQDFDKREHPMLRAYKLSKRICRDRKITRE